MPKGKKKPKKKDGQVVEEERKPGHQIARGGVAVEYDASLMALAADSEFDWNEELPPEQASQLHDYIEGKRKQRRDMLSKGRDDRVARHTSKLDNNILSGLSRYELEIRKREAQEFYVRDKFNPSFTNPPLELPLERFPKALPIPTRPKWDKSMDKKQFLKNEEMTFKEYLEDLYKEHGTDELNYFEHNLEVWRQLWRCVEVSDIVLMMADIRFPMFHFPSSVYETVRQMYPDKPMMLALTKVDLVPQSCVDAWTNYFHTHYPLLTLCPIASYQTIRNKDWYQNRKQKKTEQSYNPKGIADLLRVAQSFGVKREGEMVWFLNEEDKGTVEIKPYLSEFNNTSNVASDTPKVTTPKPKPEEVKDSEPTSQTEKSTETTAPKAKGEYGNEFMQDYFSASSEEEEEPEETENEMGIPLPPKPKKESKNAKKYVTIGLIGQPNVGKSTLINALKGSKVVSESSTPGHTKWRQTIFLNPNLLICDCPGLVFPFVGLPKELQVILGLYPLASVCILSVFSLFFFPYHAKS
eukprot:TRINITY_DN1789_c0_g1_i2.p1 TRINITY_DN1789_c0_g1~~TRINITY_DN1789_c0_g1_i2.p1  ORF type:complete len:524 (-),score=120.21 TRINITY_DN1789_c0_g1_i2:512-2083(-)